MGTAANEHDVTQAAAVLQGQEQLVLGDAGYRGVEKRHEHQGRGVQWHIAMRPGKRRVLGTSALDRLADSYERFKASLRARIEHPFRVIKCQFGFRKVQVAMMKNPEAGDLIEGTGGLRKLRHGAPRRGKGKRSGLRVIYYWWDGGSQFWLFTLYDKDEMADLNPDEKKVLKSMLKVELEARR